jgi:hypothetical protein
VNDRSPSRNGRKEDSRFTGNTKYVAQVAHALVRRKMLDHLIDGAAHRDASFDTQAATFFPRLALHPADVAKQAAVLPAVDVGINLKDSLEWTLQHNFKIEGVHGTSSKQISKRSLKSRRKRGNGQY